MSEKDPNGPLTSAEKALTAEEVIKIRHSEWYNIPQLVKVAAKKHEENLAACHNAIEHYQKKDRKIEVLVIHGSSRSNYDLSQSREMSNSQMLLEYGLKELDDSINITRINLRDKDVHPCDGCVSTASALCGFPCNCFPLDPMQEYYPLILKADVILISTPVNQSAMSSRLKIFCDRLISLDGGFLVDNGQFRIKDKEWRDKAVEISKDGNFEYAARLAGRVCAYFISSKDQNNPVDIEYDYAKQVAGSLKQGFEDFGCFHPDEYYVVSASNPDEDYSRDKAHLNLDIQAQEKSKALVKSAIALGEKYRKNPPENKPGRKNRT